MEWKRNPCGTFAKSAQAHSFAEYINITVCGADRFTIAINIKVLVHLGNFPMKKKNVQIALLRRFVHGTDV